MEYIIINYDNCNKSLKISLDTKFEDEWTNEKIQSYLIQPDTISSIIIGPQTVLEMYNNLETGSYKVINDSTDQTKTYKFFNCPKTDDEWSAHLYAFKIWSYDYYNKKYIAKLCDSNSDCESDELCMCPSGKTNALWCPQSKRRCMNEKYYFDSSEIPINDEDKIKTKCLRDKLNTEHINFKELKHKFRPCMLDKLKVIENFDYNHYSYLNYIIYFLLLVIVIRLYQKYH